MGRSIAGPCAADVFGGRVFTRRIEHTFEYRVILIVGEGKRGEKRGGGGGGGKKGRKRGRAEQVNTCSQSRGVSGKVFCVMPGKKKKKKRGKEGGERKGKEEAELLPNSFCLFVTLAVLSGAHVAGRDQGGEKRKRRKRKEGEGGRPSNGSGSSRIAVIPEPFS